MGGFENAFTYDKFYCIFKNEFSKNFESCSFDTSNFFRKISQNFPKFVKIFQLFQNRKIDIIFELKLVQNLFIDQNLVKFSPKSKKTANFSLKTAIFSKFSPPSAPKICTFDTQKTRIFVVRAPPEAMVPLIHL